MYRLPKKEEVHFDELSVLFFVHHVILVDSIGFRELMTNEKNPSVLMTEGLSLKFE